MKTLSACAISSSYSWMLVISSFKIVVFSITKFSQRYER
nr:MAG TPA: hypothetical protein [Caudoviricetes sp.]